ncbi:hypothetical protein A3D03_01590 [Candidatus Gottesmanbacteria bacterium RIFCSPHIGHO2_02_FULL_40_13]|uniref:Uncharacterized protein n=1 Tax=Candidatus Gottesmanbacteria bacterium RIFCSPHIGHO2_02_FULL_40_13 TaxID=1798384 RepID=A0A1F6A7A1_9BACT|nr:MAG: hypothetical protein A3D03_01590 [Candidatus Gottesmanbacteria bacterium RIFCSPHIGHO2_02_FULL_40_13]
MSNYSELPDSRLPQHQNAPDVSPRDEWFSSGHSVRGFALRMTERTDAPTVRSGSALLYNFTIPRGIPMLSFIGGCFLFSVIRHRERLNIYRYESIPIIIFMLLFGQYD